jgi:hypothetical protein
VTAYSHERESISYEFEESKLSASEARGTKEASSMSALRVQQASLSV